jgi:hypothetical protein
MAGLGTRFKQEGFSDEKPLIEVNGKTLIEHSIESLNLQGKYIFITRKYENPQDNLILSKKIKSLKPDAIEILIDKVTNGAVETCLFAKDLIDNEEELIITNCDQRLEWNPEYFLNFISQEENDGVIVTHQSNNPKHSYALVNSKNIILSLHEKNVISNNALIGLHYWKKGKDFINSAEILLSEFKKNKRPECYVSESYNYLINQDKKILNFKIKDNEYIPLGTPYDLNVYKGKIKEFFTKKPKTIFCDLDGTILNHVHCFSDLKENSQKLLDKVLEKFNEWDSQGHKIILCTARKESAREMTEKHLKFLGISWDCLIMGLTSGERILINDKINSKCKDRARSINLITNQGFKNINWEEYDL